MDEVGESGGKLGFSAGPRARPRAGPRGAREIATFSLFSEKFLRRVGFSENFLKIREKSRRTRPPRDFFRDSGDFSGGKVPGVPACPGNSSGFFIFLNPAHFSAPWAPGAPLFPEKCEKKPGILTGFAY